MSWIYILLQSSQPLVDSAAAWLNIGVAGAAVLGLTFALVYVYRDATKFKEEQLEKAEELRQQELQRLETQQANHQKTLEWVVARVSEMNTAHIEAVTAIREQNKVETSELRQRMADNQREISQFNSQLLLALQELTLTLQSLKAEK